MGANLEWNHPNLDVVVVLGEPYEMEQLVVHNSAPAHVVQQRALAKKSVHLQGIGTTQTSLAQHPHLYPTLNLRESHMR